MIRRSLQWLALGALTASAAVTQAAAGSCCNVCAAPCVAPVPVVAVQPVPVPPVFVVNQGPLYTGPGIMTYPGYFNEWRAPAFYPYVSVDYYYPAYSPYYYEPRRYRHVSYRAKPAHRAYTRPLDPRDK